MVVASTRESVSVVPGTYLLNQEKQSEALHSFRNRHRTVIQVFIQFFVGVVPSSHFEQETFV